MTDNVRIWWEIGRLQGQVEVLREQVAELERERSGPTIDNPPQPRRRKGKNVIPFPVPATKGD